MSEQSRESTESRVGELVIGGFPGPTLPPFFERALRDGRRGGAILFKQNVEGGPRQIASLTRAIHATSAQGSLVGIDQEGGRVVRLKAPCLEIPPMRVVASWQDEMFAERIARAVGVELAALGFTWNFAPVLDVNTCEANPVIGDRAFGTDAQTCARFGTAWVRGLQSAGLLACGKHFPGHGDTSKDSHFDLPVVDQARARLEALELVPFRAAVEAGVASLMTAHVVYSSIDAERPATMTPLISTDLRRAIGFDGVLVSDDLEMQAIASRMSPEESAVQAIAAGCDALLICWSEDKQERAIDALAREVRGSVVFRARCEEALQRVRVMRRRVTVRPQDDDTIEQLLGGIGSRNIAAEISRRSTP